MRAKNSLAAAAVVLAALLTGCASGYQQFYRPAPGATPEALAAERAAPPTGSPLVERASSKTSADEIIDAYARRGYVLIGSSSFNSGQSESDAAAVEQGRRVGADLVVILDPRYTGTVNGSIPITTPTTSTSYTQGTATAYGKGGPVTAYGSSTTTTYGTQTNYVPFAVNRNDYSAGYFVKRRWAFGAMWRDLTDAERQALQSNRGVAVRLVVEGTPAFIADILPGDIILAVNGAPVFGQEELSRLIRANAGKKTPFTVYRQGGQRQIDVQLN
ncbi:MAG TPA: PDZ domain-containing protein [Roseateles sp.]